MGTALRLPELQESLDSSARGAQGGIVGVSVQGQGLDWIILAPQGMGTALRLPELQESLDSSARGAQGGIVGVSVQGQGLDWIILSTGAKDKIQVLVKWTSNVPAPLATLHQLLYLLNRDHPFSMRQNNLGEQAMPSVVFLRMTLPMVSHQPIPWILPLHFHEAANGEFNAPSGSVGIAEAAVSIGDLQDSPVLSQSFQLPSAKEKVAGPSCCIKRDEVLWEWTDWAWETVLGPAGTSSQLPMGQAVQPPVRQKPQMAIFSKTLLMCKAIILA
ncbi:hypothetical protein HGM15179_015680 [Zosterops borbonicus]|uniref:Uncharacterized protein n=1 Tax=Zosterops borbonicus TaxID=364589 RepID=A0A8K1G4D4_9PASS|nr:hypothetical protein HGM15179_015680 [Zosterops borbonicus]